ncbi:ABC transporter [Streptomyces sp. UNOC14_S4]|uniref:ABC transporter n=1 Tax=Streptomyces sp. UNOC14_S4 TaxID=2872340 RepID=UPI001E2B9A0D|nr:ABC transporter [Streptomyces sp. UNOC14_S4]MCC3772039.1 ABC transporter [Streptomyces sp. UNOC14_S4]
MTALVRYQAALLLRSHRWLAPLLLYGVFIAVGVQQGNPVLDSFGYAAGALLPVAAWLVRVCVTNEPSAARDCTGAAAGPWRVHLAAVLTALGASTALALAGTAVVAAISDFRSADHQVHVPLWPATAAGTVAALACALLGTGVGALCNRPLLRSTAWAVPSTVLATFLVLFAGVSPANAAVTGLVGGSHHGTVVVSLLPLAAAALLGAAAVAVACVLSSRRP